MEALGDATGADAVSFIHQVRGPLLGLNQDENPHALRDGELVDCDNIYRSGNQVGTRPGTERPGSGKEYDAKLPQSSGADVPIQGIFEYRKDFDDTRVLAVVAENSSAAGDLYFDDQSTDTYGLAASTNIPKGQNAFYTMTEHENLLYGAGGDVWTSQTPTTGSFWQVDASDTSSPADVTLIESSANEGGLPTSNGDHDAIPTFAFSWRGYMFANGFRRIGGASGNILPDCNPTVTRYCEFGTDPSDGDNWFVGNTIGFNSSLRGVDSFGSDFSTGFGTFQDNRGDWLLLLGQKTISAVQFGDFLSGRDFVVLDHINPGCVSQRAFVNLGLDSGDAIYQSPLGFHSLRVSQEYGNRDRFFLSWKIRPLIKTLNPNRLRFTVGAYNADDGYVAFAVSTGSNTAHDTILILDVKDQESINAQNAIWYVWHLEGGIFVQDLKFIRDEDNASRLAIATTLGDILYFSTDAFNDVNVTDSGTAAYNVFAQTKHDDHGSTLVNKKVGDVIVTLSPGGAYTPQMQFIFDYGARSSRLRNMTMPDPTSTATWGPTGTMIWGQSSWSGPDVTRDTKVYGAGSGRTISFRFQHGGNNEPFRISKVAYQVSASGEAAGDPA